MDNFKNKKILVAGGTGTIGIPLVRRLVGLGARVLVSSLDDPWYANKVLPNEANFLRLDLTLYENCLRATEGQDYLFNLVGIKGSVGIGETKVASFFIPMMRYQTNLMEAAFRNAVKKYLFVSSINVYPPGEIHEEDNAWNGLPKQNDKYPGLAKRIGEIQGETYLKQYGWDAVRIIRLSNVYGPFDDFNPETGQVIPSLIARVAGGENPLRVWGDGTAARDFIFVDDVIQGMLLAVEKAPACVPVNIGSGKGVTIKELAEITARAAVPAPKIEWDVSKPSGDAKRILSIKRAQELLGFLPKVSLEEGIKITTEWYLANRETAQARPGALEHYERKK